MERKTLSLISKDLFNSILKFKGKKKTKVVVAQIQTKYNSPLIKIYLTYTLNIVNVKM